MKKYEKKLKSLSFIRDKKAKSLTFFYRGKPENAIMDNKILDLMKKISVSEKTNLRLNLHNNQKSLHHDMFILQRKNFVYPIHNHERNSETVTIIEGKIAIKIFSKNNTLIREIILSPRGLLALKIPDKKFHSVEILSKYAIYYEARRGPYIRNRDITFR